MHSNAHALAIHGNKSFFDASDAESPTDFRCSDYNPRLVFKDDTPRILERLQNINTVGNTIWDRKSC
jgi:hypothetical protein